MNWKLAYLPEAEKDLRGLDGSQRILVLKAIKKVLKNPLPADENGYGKPLGSHSRTDLAGFLKIKLKASRLRVVYKLQRIENQLLVIVIGIRADEEVYEIAQKRAAQNNLLGYYSQGAKTSHDENFARHGFFCAYHAPVLE